LTFDLKFILLFELQLFLFLQIFVLRVFFFYKMILKLTHYLLWF